MPEIKLNEKVWDLSEIMSKAWANHKFYPIRHPGAGEMSILDAAATIIADLAYNDKPMTSAVIELGIELEVLPVGYQCSWSKNKEAINAVD